MVAHCDIQSPRPPNGSQPWAWYLVWPKLSISQDRLVETVHFFCMYYDDTEKCMYYDDTDKYTNHDKKKLLKDNNDKTKIVKAYIKLYQLTVLVPFLLNLTYLLF